MMEVLNENLIDEMRRVLQPQGTLNVVSLNFIRNDTYFNLEFVKECLNELEQVVFNISIGLEEKPSNLQTLAILLLMDSAEYHGGNIRPQVDDSYTRGNP